MKLKNTKDDKMILKSVRQKNQITYHGRAAEVITGFSTAARELQVGNNTFGELGGICAHLILMFQSSLSRRDAKCRHFQMHNN